jgi:hypothetical protein
MDSCLKRAVQAQIILENTSNTILTIAEKYNVVNYVTGVYRHPESK